MIAHRLSIVIALALVALLCVACDRSSLLKGQANSTVVFYGLAVDQDGKPLADAEFVVDVEAIPTGWTFETRGKPHDHSTVSFKSGPDGTFAPKLTGHILRFQKCTRPGYRHLYDLYDRANMAYFLNAWGDLWYKTDPEHPAVYVFVKDGAHEVSALPCAGGYDSGNGRNWRLNQPGWPREPSLKDVVRKAPTTVP